MFIILRFNKLCYFFTRSKWNLMGLKEYYIYYRLLFYKSVNTRKINFKTDRFFSCTGVVFYQESVVLNKLHLVRQTRFTYNEKTQ